MEDKTEAEKFEETPIEANVFVAEKTTYSKNKQDVICFNCGKKGYLRSECYQGQSSGNRDFQRRGQVTLGRSVDINKVLDQTTREHETAASGAVDESQTPSCSGSTDVEKQNTDHVSSPVSNSTDLFLDYIRSQPVSDNTSYNGSRLQNTVDKGISMGKSVTLERLSSYLLDIFPSEPRTTTVLEPRLTAPAFNNRKKRRKESIESSADIMVPSWRALMEQKDDSSPGLKMPPSLAPGRPLEHSIALSVLTKWCPDTIGQVLVSEKKSHLPGVCSGEYARLQRLYQTNPSQAAEQVLQGSGSEVGEVPTIDQFKEHFQQVFAHKDLDWKPRALPKVTSINVSQAISDTYSPV
ncbi:hypothetical protein WN48_06949 [Eufriesea mexicana]|uniref:CCHC-type domain-containing protein n=1 Tax=Eufriesea mexicana TaxID=516756 RepID=A0A310SLH5_9HYME|nr:hypothetical protein WN48_06949 [Eufriesea mexicana]